MYTIYADEQCIYNDLTPLEAYKVVSPVLTMEDSAAGSLRMTVPPTNVGHETIQKLVTSIRVLKHDEEIWAGRVLTEDRDFYNNRILYCEGELAFLNDTTQPQREYHNMTVRGFLEALIRIHNEKADADKQFTVGAVTVTDPNDSLYRYTNYENTLECINEKMVSRLGGHIRIRKENGVRYIDYLKNAPHTNSQVIQFGKNLLDFTRSWDVSEFATVLLPLGARLDENENEIDALESYLTVESVNGGSPYVISDNAVAAYGRIEKVVRWDDVNLPENLLRKARAYLADLQFEDMSLELTAVDLHYLDINEEDVKLLDSIRVLSPPHGLDRYFPVAKLQIPLDSPSETTFTLGTNVRTSLTSSTHKTNVSVQQTIEQLPKKSVILEEARANATAILNQKTTGYITIVSDDQGSDALYISETQDYRNATRFWRFNMNGLGFTNNGGGTFTTAITMNGQIVADFVSTGVLNGNLLRAGSVQAEAISQTFKTTIANDISGAMTTIRQEFTAADGELKSEIEEDVEDTYATKTSLQQTSSTIMTEVNKKVNNTDFGTKMTQNYDSFILGFNNNSSVIRISTSGFAFYQGGSISDSTRVLELTDSGMKLWRTGQQIGNIGTNSIDGKPTCRGLVFDLEMAGSYMTWARKMSSTSDTYSMALSYSRANGAYTNAGIHLGTPFYGHNNTLDSVNLTNVSTGGTATFTGTKTFITAIRQTAAGIEWDSETYTIKNGMFTN